MKDAKVCKKGAKFSASMRVSLYTKKGNRAWLALHVGRSRTKRTLAKFWHLRCNTVNNVNILLIRSCYWKVCSNQAVVFYCVKYITCFFKGIDYVSVVIRVAVFGKHMSVVLPIYSYRNSNLCFPNSILLCLWAQFGCKMGTCLDFCKASVQTILADKRG